MSELVKNILMWLFIAVTMFTVFSNFSSDSKQEVISYSEFLAQVESDQVLSVEFQNDNYTINGKTVNGKNFETVKPPFLQDDLSEILRDHRVSVIGEKPEQQSILKQLLVASFPILIILAVFIFFMRQMQGGISGKSGPMSFGKSKAKMLEGGKVKTNFTDVAGIEEAKEEVQEIVDFLQDPSKFQKLGGKIPTGILMVGSPGTGKTLLSRAIAGEAQVPFFTISGSDFVEMFVGVGASRVRDMFEQAKRQAPCIVFIDEIDAVGRHRGAGLGGGHDEREQTLNALLVEMDGFNSEQSVIILAATNRPDVLDPALLRPGRFDRQIIVDAPDYKGRLGILKVHTKKIILNKRKVKLEELAKGTPGLVGADLANLVNEAALLAARKKKKAVDMDDFEEAKDKVMIGIQRKSVILSDDEKKVTAYHESGHALVAALTPGADPIHKVTIIPRGRALGVTTQIPIDEKHTYPKDYIEGRLAILLGGRAAESMIFNELTTGAGNDIEQATNIARKMVCEWGMSENLGPMTFGKKNEEIFLGREIQSHRDYSETTARLIDDEVVKIIRKAEKSAKQILKKNDKILHAMASALLKHETIDHNDVEKILDGKILRRRKVNGVAKTTSKKRKTTLTRKTAAKKSTKS